jgi:Haem-binding domain
MLKKILFVLLIALVLIQFFRPQKNISPQGLAQTAHISSKYPVPFEVNNVLKTACYDCHSNNTNYPWYANVQPVAWWLANHIKDGKKELNFDEFTTYNLRKQYHKLEEVSEQVEHDEMPLYSYTLIHKDALLTEEQKTALKAWADNIRNKMEASYPGDSLVRKPNKPAK